MNILRGAFAPGRNGGGGGGKGGGGAGGDEKPHAQAKLLSPTEKCKVIFLFHQPWFCIRRGISPEGVGGALRAPYSILLCHYERINPISPLLLFIPKIWGGGVKLQKSPIH